MTNFNERVGKSLGRHFVTLSCVQHPREGGDMKVHVISGFVVAVKGEWFYMTAGHILRDIRQAIEGGSTFDIWRFGDQTAGNNFQNTAIPYDFDLEKWFVLENAEAGLDYATVHIGGLLRQLFAAGSVTPLDRNAWGNHLTAHDEWALVGIPRETVEYDGNTTISARFVMAPLTQVDAPPLAEQRAENQFYAQLAENSDGFMQDVDGMSGGPVFMLYQVGEAWKYKLIGVQSAWYRASRILAICPFSSFGEALEPIVEEALLIASQTNSVSSAA